MTIKEMPRGKASGPDGMPIEFYKAFWKTIQRDLVALITKFFQNRDTKRGINRATITLIPKNPHPQQLQTIDRSV